MIFKNRKGGFTLIELLVVISIIGMLSSVVLASLNGARDKGRIAAGLQFASRLFTAYGSGAFGVWTFNELVGTSVPDYAPNDRKRNLDPYTSEVITLSDVTPKSGGKSLSIVSSGPYPRTSLVFVGTIPKLTASAWVYFDNVNLSGTGNIISVGDGNNDIGAFTPLSLVMIDGTMRCEQKSNSIPTVLTFTGVQPRKWHHVTCSVNTATKKLGAYLDGKMIAPISLQDANPIVKPGAAAVGGLFGPVGGFGCAGCSTIKMYIDDAAVYFDSPL